MNRPHVVSCGDEAIHCSTVWYRVDRGLLSLANTGTVLLKLHP